MKISLDALRQEMHLRDGMHTQLMRNLSEKLDYAIDIRERLMSLEARSPRQIEARFRLLPLGTYAWNS